MDLTPGQEHGLKAAHIVADTLMAHLKANLHSVSELEWRSFGLAYYAIKLLAALVPREVGFVFERAAATLSLSQMAADAAPESLKSEAEIAERMFAETSGIPGYTVGMPTTKEAK